MGLKDFSCASTVNQKNPNQLGFSFVSIFYCLVFPQYFFYPLNICWLFGLSDRFPVTDIFKKNIYCWFLYFFFSDLLVCLTLFLYLTCQSFILSSFHIWTPFQHFQTCLLAFDNLPCTVLYPCWLPLAFLKSFMTGSMHILFTFSVVSKLCSFYWQGFNSFSQLFIIF